MEEPSAGKPHAGICEGGGGRPPPLLDRRLEITSHALISWNSVRKFISARLSCTPNVPRRTRYGAETGRADIAAPKLISHFANEHPRWYALVVRIKYTGKRLGILLRNLCKRRRSMIVV